MRKISIIILCDYHSLALEEQMNSVLKDIVTPEAQDKPSLERHFQFVFLAKSDDKASITIVHKLYSKYSMPDIFDSDKSPMIKLISTKESIEELARHLAVTCSGERLYLCTDYNLLTVDTCKNILSNPEETTIPNTVETIKILIGEYNHSYK